MSDKSKLAHTKQAEAQMRSGNVPPWVPPLIRVSDRIYPWFLAISGLCLLLILTMLLVGKTELPWLLNALSAFSFFGTIGFLALLIAQHESFIAGWVGVVLAVAFRSGAPYLLALLAQQGGISARDSFLGNVGATVPNFGLVLATMSIIRLMVGYTVKYMHYHAEHRTKHIKYMDTSTEDTVHRSLVPKCWQMSRCRPGVRMTCPNYIDRMTCWKRRSGCFCDRELANYLVGEVDRKDAQEIIEVQRIAGANSQSTAIRGHMKTATKRPWKLQRTLCYNCPLFIEHQEYKYKNLSWVSFPVTLAIVAACWTTFDWVYHLGAGFLDELVRASLKNVSSDFMSTDSTAALANSPFEYVILAVLTLLLASYIISLTEIFFLKWKM